MEKNEVVKSEVKENEEIYMGETSEAVESKVEVSLDLKEIVKLARFEEVKSKYGVRHPYIVTFFNDEKVEFSDPDGFYDLLLSYQKCGIKDYIKSKQLVEEVKTTEDGETRYICMKYVLSDGSVYRLFTRKFSSNKIIYNYYAFYKKQQAEKK